MFLRTNWCFSCCLKGCGSSSVKCIHCRLQAVLFCSWISQPVQILAIIFKYLFETTYTFHYVMHSFCTIMGEDYLFLQPSSSHWLCNTSHYHRSIQYSYRVSMNQVNISRYTVLQTTIAIQCCPFR